jgi:pyrimidine operon attenuation protein/uracil phosphoribosyltransferase
MSVTLKATVMDADQIRRSLSRIAHEIVERNRGVDSVVLVGIVSKGDVLARRLAGILSSLEETKVEFGRLNVSKHRDDLHLRPQDGRRPGSEVPDVDGKRAPPWTR